MGHEHTFSILHVALLLGVALSITSTMFWYVLADTSGYGFRLVLFFEEPLMNNSWRVHVVLEGRAGISCEGVLTPNVYYLQTRSISRDLVVTPLYYVLDRVCPRVLDAIEETSNGAIFFELRVPEGYAVRTGMDWRGYGRVGGPYTVDAGLFRKYYLFDGVVVANSSIYRVLDYPKLNVSIVAWRGLSMGDLDLVVSTLVTVRSAASSWLGSSPRAPTVAVIVGSSEHEFLPPGTAHSIGGVVYLKTGFSIDATAWLVHTIAHETLHGWFNHGMLYGGFGFQEAAAEFLAMRALYEKAPRLYEFAQKYLVGLLSADEQYGVWMRAHSALWYAGLKVCQVDVYTAALRKLFIDSLATGPREPITLPDLVMLMLSLAPAECRNILKQLIGGILVAVATDNATWPYINTSTIDWLSRSGKTLGVIPNTSYNASTASTISRVCPSILEERESTTPTSISAPPIQQPILTTTPLMDGEKNCHVIPETCSTLVLAIILFVVVLLVIQAKRSSFKGGK